MEIMSHVQQRAAAVECPLASLGHNTPTLDSQGYHHPLSTSPLDPQAYQMLRKSQESPILSIDTDKIRYTIDTNRNNRSVNTTLSSNDSQNYPSPRKASTPLDDTSTTFLSRRDLQRLRNQTYTPIDTITRQFPHPPPSQRGRSTYNLNETSLPPHELTDVERFFLGEKMASIFIDSAIRNGSTSSGGSGTNRSNNTLDDRINENGNKYIIHQDYNYYSIPNGQISAGYSSSPKLRRRTSSPDTSGSDRYFLDRMRGSPAFISRNAKLTNIKSTDDNCSNVR